MIILILIGGLITIIASYLYYESRIENIRFITQALVWKSLSMAFSTTYETEDEISIAERIINVFKTDMNILKNISAFQFLFGNIPSLLSAEAQSAINEYALAVNSIKVK